MPLSNDELADVIAAAVQEATEPLHARITVLERLKSITVDDVRPVIASEVEKAVALIPRQAATDVEAMVLAAVTAIPTPKDGTSVTVADLEPLILTEVSKAVSALPPAKDGHDGEHGKSIEPFEVEAMVRKAVDAIPKPQDGTSVTVADLEPVITAQVSKAVAELPPAKDGKHGQSVDPSDVEAMVRKAVAEIPKPQDGQDGTSVSVDELQPVIEAVVRKQVDEIPKPKDAVSVLNAVIDRNGHLQLTLSDGATKDLGVVVGRDADIGDIERLVNTELAKWPRPQDGKDGLGFDDTEVVYDEAGRAYLQLKNGDQVKSWLLQGAHLGGFKEGHPYGKGDRCQLQGHEWEAREANDGSVRPDEYTAEGKRLWVLRVRRGKQGSAGTAGAKGLDGKNGRDGQDWGRG